MTEKAREIVGGLVGTAKQMVCKSRKIPEKAEGMIGLRCICISILLAEIGRRACGGTRERDCQDQRGEGPSMLVVERPCL